MTPKEMAAAFREQLGLGDAPIRDLPALIATGTRVDVAVMNMPAGLDGMTRKDPESEAFIVAVATTDNPERQRFSLAHELGHILFGDFETDASTVHATGPNETRAHDFARHFLAPVEGVRRVVDSLPGAGPETLTSAVVQHYGVSPMPALIQLQAVGAITAGDRASLSSTTSQTLATRFGWSEERAAQIADSQRPQPPQTIVAAATRAYADGKLSLRILARLRGVTDIPALEAELAAAGMLPVPQSLERPQIDVDDW